MAHVQRLPDTFTSQNAVAMDAAVAATLLGLGRNYGEIPARLALEITLASILGGGTWTPTVEGSMDGTAWRSVFTGTGRTANVVGAMEYVPADRLVFTQHRVTWANVGGGTITSTTTLRAVLER